MKYGLSADDFTKVKNEILNNLGNTTNPKIYLYGSRVKGTYRQFSDIDILLVAESYDENALSKIDFESLDIPYKVDFVLNKDLFAPYRPEIEAHMVEV